MSDPSEPEIDALAEKLLRSARLDVARGGARDRAVSALLAATAHAERRKRRFVALAACAAVALGAVLLLTLRDPRAPKLAPEPAAPSASARLAPPPPAPSRPACPKIRRATGSDPLVDDFEDRNARLLLREHRDGHWAVYNDGTGKQKPPALSSLHPTRLAQPRGRSRWALHTSGDTFTSWGAMFIADFSTGACYDASAYAGIAFWARGNTRIHVGAQMIDQVSVQHGGVCREASCPSGPVRAFDLGKDWERYTLRWDELGAERAAPILELDPARLSGLSINIYPEDTPFDVWVDDVEFLPR